MHVLVTGASSGVGLACATLLEQQGHAVTRWSSADCDFDYPDRIFTHDLSGYHMVINCAGHGQGHNHNFFTNTWQNQLSQVMVNYVSNIFLYKHYVNSVSAGRYVWIGSRLTACPQSKPWQAVYTTTKSASAITIDSANQDQSHVSTLEIMLGLTRSNFRYRSQLGFTDQQEIEQMWNSQGAISSEQAASRIIEAAFSDCKKILIE